MISWYKHAVKGFANETKRLQEESNSTLNLRFEREFDTMGKMSFKESNVVYRAELRRVKGPTMSEILASKEPQLKVTLRLACGHRAEEIMSLTEFVKLKPQIEATNVEGKQAYCQQCKSHSVISCIYRATQVE